MSDVDFQNWMEDTIDAISETQKISKINPIDKLNWSGICATSTGRHQCSKNNCIIYPICLIKDASLLTSNQNQRKNVQKGVSHSDTLRILPAFSDTDNLTKTRNRVSRIEGCRINPQECSRKANVADKEDTSDGTLSADSKLPKGFKKGKCKCGNSYGYCGVNIGYCVKCIDKMEVKNGYIKSNKNT